MEDTSLPVVQSIRTPGTRGRRTKKAWWLGALALVAALSTLGGVLYTHLRPSSRQSAIPLRIAALSGGLDCPHDLSWSPDGKRVAVLGYQGDCPYLLSPKAHNASGGIAHVAGLVKIYDAHSGAPLTTLHPDDLIVPAITLPPVVAAYAKTQLAQSGLVIDFFDINYTHALWSPPDGQRLALTFTVRVPTGLPVASGAEEPVWPETTFNGLLLLSADGSGSRVLLSAPHAGDVSYTEWDLSAGAVVPAPASMTALAPSTPGFFTTVPVASAFRWGADGRLGPVGLLSATAAPSLASVGNPDGDTVFTVWQPGIATVQSDESAHTLLRSAFTLTTDIAAWSPDGRYLASGIAFAGLLSSPQSQDIEPRLPVRDAALRQASVVAKQHAFPALVSQRSVPAGSGVLVAWSPDGQTLAMAADTSDHGVTLYDCASGRQVSTLAPPGATGSTTGVRTASREQGEASLLRWSPDGSRLSLLDAASGALTIWHV